MESFFLRIGQALIDNVACTRMLRKAGIDIHLVKNYPILLGTQVLPIGTFLLLIPVLPPIPAPMG